MPRDIPVGNGNILAAFDKDYQKTSYNGTVAKCAISRHSEAEGRRISTMNRFFPFAMLRVRMTKSDILQQSHNEKEALDVLITVIKKQIQRLKTVII